MRRPDNFDVLREMSARGGNIQIAPLNNILRMQKVKLGTQITIGVGGDVLTGITMGKFVGGLLLADRDEFTAIQLELDTQFDKKV